MQLRYGYFYWMYPRSAVFPLEIATNTTSFLTCPFASTTGLTSVIVEVESTVPETLVGVDVAVGSD